MNAGTSNEQVMVMITDLKLGLFKIPSVMSVLLHDLNTCVICSRYIHPCIIHMY